MDSLANYDSEEETDASPLPNVLSGKASAACGMEGDNYDDVQMDMSENPLNGSKAPSVQAHSPGWCGGAPPCATTKLDSGSESVDKDEGKNSPQNSNHGSGSSSSPASAVTSNDSDEDNDEKPKDEENDKSKDEDPTPQPPLNIEEKEIKDKDKNVEDKVIDQSKRDHDNRRDREKERERFRDRERDRDDRDRRKDLRRNDRHRSRSRDRRGRHRSPERVERRRSRDRSLDRNQRRRSRDRSSERLERRRSRERNEVRRSRERRSSSRDRRRKESDRRHSDLRGKDQDRSARKRPRSRSRSSDRQRPGNDSRSSSSSRGSRSDVQSRDLKPPITVPLKRSHSRSKSPDKERSKSAVGETRKFYLEKKIDRKLNVLERMGIELKAEAKPCAGPVTPQMLVQRTMEQEALQVKKATGVELPSYYNAAAVNPQRLVDQIQKRKLLWGGKKEDPSKAVAQPQGVNKWQGATFAQDQDGKLTAKFNRLMGIKQPAQVPSNSSGESTTTGSEIIKKQEEMFHNMESQYEVARLATHTHRGLGLGFGTFQPR